jgi:hypothetical protein
MAGAVGADVTVTVTLGLAETVAVRLGKLPIELLIVLPHPAASNPAATRVTGRESLFAERRMLILPRRLCRPLKPPFAGNRDRCRTRPDGLAAQPYDPQPAWLGRFCLRHHRDCAAPRVGSEPVISARRVRLLHPAPAQQLFVGPLCVSTLVEHVCWFLGWDAEEIDRTVT